MRLYTILVFLTMFLSCKDKTYIGNNPIKQFPKHNNLTLENIITPRGNQIKFKTVGAQAELQWFCDGKLRTLSETFDLNGASAWLPQFIMENDRYILLRAGCGNPCWQGFFLPLHKEGKEIIIHEYLAVDLVNNFTAYINYDKNNLEVLNLETGKKQSFNLGKCDSAFMGYCIDTIYFKTNKLYYKWIPETYINSKKGKLICVNLQL